MGGEGLVYPGRCLQFGNGIEGCEVSELRLHTFSFLWLVRAWELKLNTINNLKFEIWWEEKKKSMSLKKREQVE